MISTQLDLFGGPPKPPKNIREEDPQKVVPPTDEKAVEPDFEPEVELSDESSDDIVFDVVKKPVNEPMPEWIEKPAQETDTEIDEDPTYNSYQDVADALFDDYALEIKDEPDLTEENETPLEVDDVKDKVQYTEASFVAPVPENAVHVQLPGHNAKPVVFTTLIPVEGFVVEEGSVEGKDEDQPEISVKLGREENESTDLENVSEVLELQDEEPTLSTIVGEAISIDDVNTDGNTEVDVDNSNTDDAQEIKVGQLQIPEDEKLFLRQYYTMRETSNMFGVNQSLLRYWENEFDVLKPKKNRKGDRYFRPEDIKNLELIYHLLKVRKFTIEGAREYIKSKKKVLDTFELVQRLEKLKGFLHELKTHL